jgi:hypothetical protein
MKASNSILRALLVVATMACDPHEEVTSVKPEQIVGDWSSEEIRLNGRPSSEILADGSDIGIYLGIRNDNTFVRNYEWGSWDLKNNTVRMINTYDSTLFRECQIIELSKNALVLRFGATEAEYYFDFDVFDKDEKIIITERYKRIE